MRRSKLIRGYSEGTTGTPGIAALGSQVKVTTFQETFHKIMLSYTTFNPYQMVYYAVQKLDPAKSQKAKKTFISTGRPFILTGTECIL